jgi:hypothetical protein
MWESNKESEMDKVTGHKQQGQLAVYGQLFSLYWPRLLSTCGCCECHRALVISSSWAFRVQGFGFLLRAWLTSGLGFLLPVLSTPPVSALVAAPLHFRRTDTEGTAVTLDR